MHVSISIVGFKNPHDIARCFTALETLSYADFEIIICENGGAEAYRHLLSVIPPALAGGQLVRAVAAQQNLGYAHGVNTCIGETPLADAWWVLNPDTEPHPDALTHLVARIQRGDCDAAGGTILFSDGTVESYGGRWHPWLARAESIGYGSLPDQIPARMASGEALSYISGASLLISRRFLETTGPMNDDYFLYCEDVEWCLRGLSVGMRLGLAPAARVIHHQGTTTGSGPDIRKRPRMPVFLDERNKILVTRDRFPTKLPIAATSAAILILLRFGRQRAWKQLGYGLQGWAAGIMNRRGRPHWLDV